jgi:hypothetical protein
MKYHLRCGCIIEADGSSICPVLLQNLGTLLVGKVRVRIGEWETSGSKYTRCVSSVEIIIGDRNIRLRGSRAARMRNFRMPTGSISFYHNILDVNLASRPQPICADCRRSLREEIRAISQRRNASSNARHAPVRTRALDGAYQPIRSKRFHVSSRVYQLHSK